MYLLHCRNIGALITSYLAFLECLSTAQEDLGSMLHEAGWGSFASTAFDLTSLL